ncbi:MAG: hypothetical protein HZB76_03695 [Chlamydiae bacterium]|nr:hypothetical protein [Chlamydiota bacterium]
MASIRYSSNFSKAILSLVFSSFLIFSLGFADDKKEAKDGFTINYNEVSIIEYIGFVSKICNVNFIYNTEDLQFNVTVVSKDPITQQNVMSTLIQVLRIHGLKLLEENHNLVIHKSEEVKELGKIVTDKNHLNVNNPIVTRIFLVKNCKIDSLTAVIRPMISKDAILEAYNETRQLIVTDVIENVKKIAELLENLESSQNPLDIESYQTKNNAASDLINLSKQIMTPLIEGQPYILVPQDITGVIYIVSTQNLVEKTLALLNTLDTPPRKTLKKLEDENIFIYKLQHNTFENIHSSLKIIINKLIDKGYSNQSSLIETLEAMKWIKENNSLLFLGSPEDIVKIKDILVSVDSQSDKYFLYKLQNVWGNIIEEQLEEFARKLKSQGVADPKLIKVILEAKWVKETNSILLTGDPQTIEEVKEIIAKYDLPSDVSSRDNFFIYKPQNVTSNELEKMLNELAYSLEEAGLADGSFLETISAMKYVDSTNSITFTGSQASIKKIQDLIKEIDTPTSKMGIQHLGKTNFFIYQIQNAPPAQMLASIKALTEDMTKLPNIDKDFIKALKTARYTKETNSLIFTGTQESLEKIKPILEKFDVPRTTLEGAGRGALSYFLYKPVNLSGPELKQTLIEFTENLKLTGVEKPDLFEAINLMNYTEKTNTLIFSGTDDTIAEIKGLISNFDVPSSDVAGPIENTFALDNLGFLVYKLQYHKGTEIYTALKQVAKELTTSNTNNQSKLATAINSIQLLDITNSLLCSGDPDTLARLKDLIKSLDVPLKQVFIEVLVIETTLSNALTFGLDWSSKLGYKNKASVAMSNIQPSTTSSGTIGPDSFGQTMNGISNTVFPTGANSVPIGAGFDLGIIGDILMHNGQSFLSLGSLMQALQTDNESTIVMTPKIITQDGKTSKIFMGQNIPYVGSNIQNQGANTLLTTNVEYRDIGMSLVITPYLGTTDTVTLTIDLESTQEPTGSTVNLGNGVIGITTNKTTMNTSVHVPNKNFLVLSGMVTDTKTKQKSGIPCLGGLPFIGAAFSQNNDNATKNNIVIFLRPHIINSYKDMIILTQEQEDFFREQAGTPDLERRFEESTELMKSYEDE